MLNVVSKSYVIACGLVHIYIMYIYVCAAIKDYHILQCDHARMHGYIYMSIKNDC
jgi:hypothetical protein